MAKPHTAEDSLSDWREDLSDTESMASRILLDAGICRELVTKGQVRRVLLEIELDPKVRAHISERLDLESFHV